LVEISTGFLFSWIGLIVSLRGKLFWKFGLGLAGILFSADFRVAERMVDASSSDVIS